MKEQRKQEGITMIALVVTIMVLIILAGISIAGISGKNGIIKQGAKAKQETEISRYRSELEELKYEKYAKKYMIEVEKFLSEYSNLVLEKVKGVVLATPDNVNQLVEVITEEGYRFEVTIEDTIYVGNDEEDNSEIDMSNVTIIITNSPENWTNGKVKVKITSNVTRVSKEYSLDGGNTWKKYENEIEIENNGTEIQARGVNDKNEKTEVVKKKIENIDRLAPNIFVPTVKGTTNKLEITANTTDKEATTTDGKSGIKGYKFSKDNGSTWTGVITEGSYTYENLQPGTTYPIKVKAIDNAGNEIETNTTNGTTEEEIILPNPAEKIQITKTPTNWTNGPVTVRMTNTATDYRIQYSTDDRSWQMYTGDIIVENNNETIYARLYNEDRKQATESINTQITNIDRLQPNISAPTLVEGIDTIKITVTATDKEATGTDGKSGIRGYKFSQNGGSSWTEEQTSNIYTFGRLTPGASYRIKVKAIDNAGNETETQEVTGTTEAIPGGNNNIFFNYSPSEWTNGNVTVTITASTEKYQLQYSKDGRTWNNYNSQTKVEMTENGPIYARLAYGENYGTTATGNVGNIDKILPTGSGTATLNSKSDKEATIQITATDDNSGLASITNKTTEFIRKENDTTYKVTKNGIFEFYVTDKAGNINTISVEMQGFLWEETKTSDTEWYSYNDVSNGDKKANVNAPKLGGNMKPIKYVGPEADTQTGSKWANAMTSDGSMWVWIPRYAYKITKGYHSSTAGTIEVAFLDINNKFLNGETGTLTTNVEEQGAGQTKWLVHPAFTSNAEYGGGFGEIPGLWVGKFEATGEYTVGNASKVSVKPGVASLRNMKVNDQYKAGKTAIYGESANLNSHMMKNSEWGVTVYLAHSKYGTNKLKVEQNKSSAFYTGGTNIIEEIYTTNKTQSTTHNATGMYDLNGGAGERVASYINNKDKQLVNDGGTNAGDLYGETETEQSTSTQYKTVYMTNYDQGIDYQMSNIKNKGDAVYETSAYWSGIASWFDSYANFPGQSSPFFSRGGGYDNIYSGTFFFNDFWGNANDYYSLRLVLIP